MFTPNIYSRSINFLMVAILTGLLILANGDCSQIFAQKPDNSKQLLEAEQLLSNLGYWILKVDGVKDASDYHAITAFQKVEGLRRTGVLTADLLNKMRTASRPTAKFSGAAHIEVDLTRQVLFLVNESGTVTHILPVSSGSEEKYFDEGKWQTAHTPRGAFQIERRINGVRKAPLGSLYYPNYFHAGVAIHGSNSIPFKPASHGCVRIPRFADQSFFNLVRLKMDVYVYD
ncbi:MAG: L,D-transpeptidase family protein [Pyrinomonadaceae bacterium]|nr:L,D-transpeptidase family protein [Pyrinomonadaceae bacterium]